MSFIKQTIKKKLTGLRKRWSHFQMYKFYSRQYKHYISLNGFQNKPVAGEVDYISKWRQLSNRVEPFSFRFFSHYCGNNPNIVPNDIGCNVIEEILNPLDYRPAYSDKNFFYKLMGGGILPKAILCRINGGAILDEKFQLANEPLSSYVANHSELLLKPSVNSSSGRGVMKFIKDGDIFYSVGERKILTKEFLLKYGNDFCLQQCVKQSHVLNQLCCTSINTIRLSAYRSYVDEEIHITGSIIRIGKNGSYVDNAHAGGKFAGVNVENGEIGKFVIDQYGKKDEVWNGVDYSNQSLKIPNWNEIIKFAKSCAKQIVHHRLIALDIALNENNTPVLIEYNLEGFSYWLFMYTGQMPLGRYTDEIIDYCKKEKMKLT